MYQNCCTRPLNPPIFGDFESSSLHDWESKGAVKVTILTFQTVSKAKLSFFDGVKSWKNSYFKWHLNIYAEVFLYGVLIEF